VTRHDGTHLDPYEKDALAPSIMRLATLATVVREHFANRMTVSQDLPYDASLHAELRRRSLQV
jgi:hypothetical protein